MRKLLFLAMALLVGAVAAPASADVFVTATITKFKDIIVLEDIVKFKTILITVNVKPNLDAAAEAAALANQFNEFNISTGVGEDERLRRTADLTDSIRPSGGLRNTGIVQLNQDVGDMVNQGNLISIAMASRNSFAEAQAEADQINAFNFSRWHVSSDFDPDTPTRKATILNSINDNTGVVQVNQNAGNMNNQLNALALALGVDTRVALSEAALGQVNFQNVVDEVATVKRDLIEGSINGNRGIVQVNQSVGNFNNQGTAVAFAATVATATIVAPGLSLP